MYQDQQIIHLAMSLTSKFEEYFVKKGVSSCQK